MFSTMDKAIIGDRKEYAAMLNDTRTLLIRLAKPSQMVLEVIQHKIDELEDKKEKLLDDFIQTKLPSHYDHYNHLYAEEKLNEVTMMLDEIYNERDIIVNARERFDMFLKAVYDPTENQFNDRIARENAMNGENSKAYKQLCQKKADYLKKMKVIDPQVELFMAEINHLVNELCNLHYYGKRFFDVVNFIKSDRYVDVHHGFTDVASSFPSTFQLNDAVTFPTPPQRKLTLLHPSPFPRNETFIVPSFASKAAPIPPAFQQRKPSFFGSFRQSFSKRFGKSKSKV